MSAAASRAACAGCAVPDTLPLPALPRRGLERGPLWQRRETRHSQHLGSNAQAARLTPISPPHPLGRPWAAAASCLQRALDFQTPRRRRSRGRQACDGEKRAAMEPQRRRVHSFCAGPFLLLHPPVVRGEEEEGVVGQALVLERGVNLPHGIVHLRQRVAKLLIRQTHP